MPRFPRAVDRLLHTPGPRMANCEAFMKTSALSLLTIALSAALLAQDPPADPPAERPVSAPAATAAGRDLLLTSLRFLQSLPTFHGSATARLVMPEGMDDAGLGELPVVLVEQSYQLPNRFALRVGEPFFTTMVCDGERLLRSDSHFAMYSVGIAPQPAIGFFTSPNQPEWSTLPGQSTMAQLLTPAGGRRALIDAERVELLADAKVGKVDCHHLVVKDLGLQCELWIQIGDEPYVRRHRPAPPGGKPTAQDGAAGAGEAAAAPTLVYDLQFIAVGKALPKTTFAIVAPPGSKQVDDLDAAIDATLRAKLAAGQHGNTHPSVGKTAPDAELLLLDGSQQRVADLRGKVVVLDFWATWCAPCVQGLPKVAAVTGKRQQQGVVFVAVNVGEGKEKVAAFLAKQGLQIQVALGGDTIGPRFGVEGIPHTVVIGRDGVVQTVHIGFGPGVEKELEAALEKALGGDAKQPAKPAAGQPDQPKK